MKIHQRTFSITVLRLIGTLPFTILAFSLPGYSGMEHCTIGDQKVNPNNGAELKGKTGRLKCVDDSTQKLVRETEYKNGVEVGYRMTISGQGEKTEQTVNEKGNSIGTVKKYDKNGKLTSEENYGPGKMPGWTTQQGVAKSYYPSGKVKHLTWYEAGARKFEMAYREDGKLSQIMCGDRSYIADDKKVCGFGGVVSKVDIYNPSGDVAVKTLSFRDGKPIETTLMTDGKITERRETSGSNLKKTEFFPNGKIKIEADYHEHVLNGDEKEYHQSGKLIRQTHWNQGKLENEKTYYLNGQIKSQAEAKKWNGLPTIARKQFWDNGTLQEEGNYLEKTDSVHWMDFDVRRWNYEVEVGPHDGISENGKEKWHENYNKDGKLDGTRTVFEAGKKVEEEYKDGILTHRERWTEDNKLELDDDYFEDGSHVSHLKS